MDRELQFATLRRVKSNMAKNEENHNITGTIMRQSEKAILLDVEDIEAWLPKSQISLVDGDAEVGATVTLSVPDWLARDKGFVG